MELIRPFAHLRASTASCTRTSSSALRYQSTLVTPRRHFSASNQRTSAFTSTRQFSTSQRYQADEPASTQQVRDQASAPTPTGSTTSSPSRPSATSTKPSNQSRWESIRKVIDEPSGSSNVRQAADDVFGDSRQRSSPAAFLTRGVLDNIQGQDERGLRDIESSIRLRLKPTLGRTRPVDFNGGFDLQAAISAVESACKQNSVRMDERNQKFHVRRGQRRKNLRSLRWRRLFKAGFVQEVGRVQRMRKQGW